MKTIRFNTPAAWMLAGLAALTFAGSAHAEESGTVRLTDAAEETLDRAADSSRIIIRGQSNLRRRNARTSQALLQLFKDENVQPAGMITQTAATNYNSCAPACDCQPSCCAPQNCCPGSGCDAGSCACPTKNGCCADGCDAAGRYRITDTRPACDSLGCDACDGGSGGYRNGNSGSWLNSNGLAGFLNGQAAAHRARNRLASANLNAYLRCRLGYFIHDGSGGVGSPLFGHYQVVYPVNPHHFDSRDGQVYAAQGYGGPVSVPLAPTVRHAYNYGWGVPSSRLTPVSNLSAH